MSKNNQFMQENSEAKEHKENLDNISHKSNLNQNEKMIIKSSNVFSIFHNENFFEIDTPIKMKMKQKKIIFALFSEVKYMIIQHQKTLQILKMK